jgi:hypothetical protein
MRTDGVVIGTLTPHRDHMHLKWACPDCGNYCGLVWGYEDGPFRFTCLKTKREFLVVGIVSRTATSVKVPERIRFEETHRSLLELCSATASNLSKIEARRIKECCHARALIEYKRRGDEPDLQPTAFSAVRRNLYTVIQ